MKCLLYETPIDTPEELVARLAEAAAIIREAQSFARRYQLCINVNGRHFQQLLLATQINGYAIWRNKMKFMEVG